MVIAVDTREQDTARSRKRYASFGCAWQREKLDFGDYSARFPLPDGTVVSLAGKVAVERKMSLDELCQCFTHDRPRFEREFERMEAAKGRMWLLIEDASWEDTYKGKYRSLMRPTALVASILAWQARYDCRLVFCRSETSGKLIHDILYREGKERMENMPYAGDEEYEI